MPRKKETRYGGKYQYFRKRITSPDGEQVTIYGKTAAERDEKVAAQLSAWATEAERGEEIFVAEYCADWFRRASAEMSEQRKVTIRREINNNIAPVIGTKLLRELTSDDVQDVLAAREGLSVSARRTTLQTLNRILSAAEAAGKIPRNPAQGIRAGGRKKKKKIALTEAQTATLLAAVEGQRIRLFCLLALYAGLRREEICGLRWDCVELDGKAPHIDVRRACRWPDGVAAVVEDILKTDAAWRSIPLPRVMVRELRAQRKALGRLSKEALAARFVVSYPDGTPWSLKSLQEAWNVIEARSTGTVKRRRKDPETGEMVTVEVEKHLGDVVTNHPGVVITIDFPVTPHLLRYTYITRLILGKVDLKRVQYLAGHADPAVTLEIYTSLMGHQPEDLIGDVRGIFDR